ncbi:hypothetical protein GOBAR_DD04619 [Gossypium barbadense]|nr:hypothetical protein GOBAR_DD04619 [Gossypium barbadense]
MLGRLASILDKELLNGQKVVVVRCEEICMWGGLVSQKMNLMRFLRERMNTDLADEVKESRMSVLEAYEGILAPYDKTKRMVIPDALKLSNIECLGLGLELQELLMKKFMKTSKESFHWFGSSRTWLSFTQSQSRLLELSPYRLSLTTYQDNTEPNLPHTEEKHSLQ